MKVEEHPSAAAGLNTRTTSRPAPAGRAGRRRSGIAGMPLLASKLAAPSLPGHQVARPRLFALLDEGAERPLTLVAAPAGSGKTILLASWISAGSAPGPVAWLSLDPGDNDPVRFWTYVLGALCRSGAVPPGNRLQTMVPSPEGDDGLLPLLVQGLDELASPVLLVLDDVHELTDPRVLHGIEFLLRHGRSRLRLVLSTRADPPLSLHRLLVSGQLTQLRAADLAFTVAEAAELFAEYDFRSRLSDDDLAMLQARTEGWAAGLRLAAVSMQQEPDLRRYVRELAGDDRSLAGYLVSEVLDRQPAELRSFLLRTCVVDELSGDLADALTGRDDGEGLLARLEQVNAFVVALGPRRAWYRYHPLFAELLRYELRRQAPQDLGELRRRAARWYAFHGMPEAAMQQAVSGQDWGHAAALIVERGVRLVLDGQVQRFHGMLDPIPADVARSHPELALLATAERIGADDVPEPSLRLAREQERMLADDRRPRLTLLLALLRLDRARRAGRLDAALDAGRATLEALSRLGDGDDLGGAAGEAQAVALSGLGTAELWMGELDAAEAHLAAGQAAAVRAGRADMRLTCIGNLALLHAIRGRLGLAVRIGEAALELAAMQAEAASAETVALLALAWVHYQRDDDAVAGRYLQRAAGRADATVDRPLAVAIRMLERWLRYADAGPVAGRIELGAVRQELAGWDPPRLLAYWAATTGAELHHASGDVESARVLLEGLATGGWTGQLEVVARARLQLAGGDPAGAVATLSPLVDGTAPPADTDTRIRAWLLHALASHALEHLEQAAASLEHAVDLAQPEDHRRAFVDVGAQGRALVARYRDWIDGSWPFLDELADASLDPAPTAVSPMPAMIEPLSERERVVLRYLPTMLTFEEIGSELYISVNTTKSHVRSIYRKLGVVGRRDAVRRARQLHLLRT
jgi:LuxR family maltose regulon positive regulatory protein